MLKGKAQQLLDYLDTHFMTKQDLTLKEDTNSVTIMNTHAGETEPLVEFTKDKEIRLGSAIMYLEPYDYVLLRKEYDRITHN